MTEKSNETKKTILRNSDMAKEKSVSHQSGDDPGQQTPVSHDVSFSRVRGLKDSIHPGSKRLHFHRVVSGHDPSSIFNEITHEVGLIYHAIRQGKEFRIESMFGLAQSIVDHDAPERLVSHVFEDQQQTFYPYLNPAHSTVIVAQVGRGLAYHSDDLVRLTVAALLHDVGSQKIPIKLMQKRGKLTSEEFAKIQTHPHEGYDLLKRYASKHPWLAQIVHQEHEREDGQGYPEGLLSENIHEEAKIIGVADIYDALITSRPYRKAMCPHEAIKEIIDCQDKLGYSRTVVRALIQQLSLFPAGCWVKLTSNEVGHVLQTNSRAPLRPVVEVLYDAEQLPLTPSRIVDLNENPLLHIVTSLCPEDRPDAAPADVAT